MAPHVDIDASRSLWTETPVAVASDLTSSIGDPFAHQYFVGPGELFGGDNPLRSFRSAE